MVYYFCTTESEGKVYTVIPECSDAVEWRPGPDETVSSVDVLIETGITETEVGLEFKCPATLAEMKLYVKKDHLCLFNGEEVYKLPLGQAVGIRKLNQGIPVEGWNKTAPPTARVFQKDGLMLWNGSCIGLRFFYALEILLKGKTVRLLFPSYELNKFRNMTSFSFSTESDHRIDNKIRPKYYWNLPKNAVFFFTHESDVSFRTQHPVAFIVLMGIGLLLLFLPMALFLWFEAMTFPPGRQNFMVPYGAILGCIGTVFAGVGLFNLVAAWVRQYLGHWVTIACLAIGGGMVALSIWLQFLYAV